jgi:hypothetical protein
MSSFGTDLTAPPSIRAWSASGSVRFIGSARRVGGSAAGGSSIELVELVGELVYGARIACRCRFRGVAWWEFNDERGAVPALVVLPCRDAPWVAPRERQSAEGGEAGLDSGGSSGSIGGGERLVEPDCEPRPEAKDQRTCEAALGL